MKIFEKQENEYILKIKLCFGLIYYKKELKNYNYNLRILGINFLKQKVEHGYKKITICGLPIYIKKTEHLLYNEILDLIEDKYSNIYVNFSCSGETYLFFTVIDDVIKNKENSILIATKKYHTKLANMLCPDIKCMYIPKIVNLQGYRLNYAEKYKNKKFFNVFSLGHYLSLENDLHKNIKTHFYHKILETLNVKKDDILPYRKPIITEEVKKSAIDKIKKIGLDIDNFIFVSPESMSNKPIKGEFWNIFTNNLYKKGYDVFLNTLFLNDKYGIGKTCFLTFEEAYFIASLSKYIITLRSGLSDVISSVSKFYNIPMIVLYTDFWDRGIFKAMSSDKVLDGFTLTKLPNINIDNLVEYNVNCLSQDELLNEILMHIK